MSLGSIYLPKRYNYIACFLTLDCNLACDYCINTFKVRKRLKNNIIVKEKWLEGLNRLVVFDELPITLQGGEPSCYPGFIWLINNIKNNLKIDILTNLCFDVEEFIDSVDPSRLNRNAPYPSIRVSYHPYHMELGLLTKNVLKMQQAGFSIGIFGILHPEFKNEILAAQKKCRDLAIDFRMKEFLGEYGSKLYGAYRYDGAVASEKRNSCLCRTSEFIIGSNGNIYKCHHDLYKDFLPIGNLLDPYFEIKDAFRECNQFGDCNPCDLKIKTNRFQVCGYTSVEIKDIK